MTTPRDRNPDSSDEPPVGPALEELLQKAYRYALSLTHDTDLARDLVQDACVAVIRRGGAWTVGYFLTTIRNRCIDIHRRRERVDFLSLDGVQVAADDPGGEPGAERPLEDALGMLGPAEREILYLSAVEGYTAAEIGELRGQPRGTVLSALHRAKKKLRRLLAAEGCRGLS